jgi:hypothetical protein
MAKTHYDWSWLTVGSLFMLISMAETQQNNIKTVENRSKNVMV